MLSWWHQRDRPAGPKPQPTQNRRSLQSVAELTIRMNSANDSKKSCWFEYKEVGDQEKRDTSSLLWEWAVPSWQPLRTLTSLICSHKEPDSTTKANDPCHEFFILWASRKSSVDAMAPVWETDFKSRIQPALSCRISTLQKSEIRNRFSVKQVAQLSPVTLLGRTISLYPATVEALLQVCKCLGSILLDYVLVSFVWRRLGIRKMN